MSVMTSPPAANEYAAYYGRYIGLLPTGDLLATLERQARETAALLEKIDEARSRHRYAEGKWSIREVIGHVIDAERVFAYRALRFARGDTIALEGFDENSWGATSRADDRKLSDMARELAALRESTIAMFRGFTDEELARGGIASENPVTVRAIAWIIAGHELHHVRILRERYLSN